MLIHQATQSNLSALISSYLPQNTSNSFDIIVRYRTQEQLDHLESIRYSILQHKKSRRRLAASILLKIIIGREIACSNCITRQQQFAREMRGYGYDKNLGTRQIKRLIASLVKNGLIRCERSNERDFRSVYRCESTELGRDAYFYYILNNDSHIQLKLLELPTNSVDNECITNEFCGTEIKMSPRNPLNLFKNDTESGHFQKNVTSNININIHIRNININMGCSKIEQITNHIFSFFHKPHLDPGDRMTKPPDDWNKNGLAKEAHEKTLDLLCNKVMTEEEHIAKYDNLFFKQIAKIQRRRDKEGL